MAIEDSKTNLLEELCKKNSIKITGLDERSGWVYDTPEDFAEKIGTPKNLTASYVAPGYDIVIATACIDGTYKKGYIEFDLVLRYRPAHFSWRGCYSHYFLNGKFTGDIRRRETKNMYSTELSNNEYRIGYSDMLNRYHIKKFIPLIEVLELKLGKKLLDEDELMRTCY